MTSVGACNKKLCFFFRQHRQHQWFSTAINGGDGGGDDHMIFDVVALLASSFRTWPRRSAKRRRIHHRTCWRQRCCPMKPSRRSKNARDLAFRCRHHGLSGWTSKRKNSNKFSRTTVPLCVTRRQCTYECIIDDAFQSYLSDCCHIISQTFCKFHDTHDKICQSIDSVFTRLSPLTSLCLNTRQFFKM